MARPKKKIQKRQKVLNFVSTGIDLIKDRWKTTIFLMCVTLYFCVVFFWIDTLAEIMFKILHT